MKRLFINLLTLLALLWPVLATSQDAPFRTGIDLYLFGKTPASLGVTEAEVSCCYVESDLIELFAPNLDTVRLGDLDFQITPYFTSRDLTETARLSSLIGKS
jgi:hypothetical protein